MGPGTAAAEWCKGGIKDNEEGHASTLREISAHHSFFARRNISYSPFGWTYRWHKTQFPSQMYYVLNEPEIGSRSLNPTLSPCPGNPTQGCWEPSDASLDPEFAGITAYWDYSITSSAGDPIYCSGNTSDHRRVFPNVLAYLYLKLWRELLASNPNNHLILPPSAARERLGNINPIFPSPDGNDFYRQTFYDSVLLSGVTIGSDTQSPITVQQMKALHVHHYTRNPAILPARGPLETTAYDASIIREAAEWSRDTYYLPFNPSPANQNLPMDIVLSEFGLPWQDLTPGLWENNPLRYTGYFPNMQEGLNWWNSLLCWITRRAPVECNLQTGYALYAAIHNPTVPPYTINSASTPTTPRNQYYYDAGTESRKVFNAMESIDTTQNIYNNPSCGATYERIFSTYPKLEWHPFGTEPIDWRVTPFGVCYAVWAQVGADKWNQLGGLADGWLSSYGEGWLGWNGIELSVDVVLPPDWSTIYFPVIKTLGTLKNDDVQFNIWTPVDYPPHDLLLGKMCMADFEDTTDFTVNVEYPYPTNPPTLETRNQRVYSAMIFPVVCYSPIVARTITIKLERVDSVNGDNETEIILGRPIVLPNACSWFVTQ